jgi:NAD(P)-dependent dehydrogenase (short-subunit alcohol dehydrogenase family)
MPEGRKRFEDAVVVVTAGGGATGAKVGEAFAAEGARVALLNRSAGPAERAAERIRAAGAGEVEVVEADLSVPDQVESAVRQVVDRWGRVDILVNNAGGGLSDTIEMPVDTWNQSLQFNLGVMFLTTRAVWPTMLAQKSGVVLNCSSIYGITATPGLLSYSVAKAGVVMFTKCLALEGAEHGIRVNCVCPGHIDSPALRGWLESLPDPASAREELLTTVPLGFLESEEAVADMYKYLASEEARWVTGSIFVIDGGTSITSA